MFMKLATLEYCHNGWEQIGRKLPNLVSSVPGGIFWQFYINTNDHM